MNLLSFCKYHIEDIFGGIDTSSVEIYIPLQEDMGHTGKMSVSGVWKIVLLQGFQLGEPVNPLKIIIWLFQPSGKPLKIS